MSVNPVAIDSAAPHPTILQMQGITKRFPGVTALDNVSFEVHRGEVHCLMGENGAGKSTLVKIMSGIYTEYEGQIYQSGQPIRLHSAKDAQRSSDAVRGCRQ